MAKSNGGVGSDEAYFKVVREAGETKESFRRRQDQHLENFAPRREVNWFKVIGMTVVVVGLLMLIIGLTKH